MSYKNIKEFIETLKNKNELLEINIPVSSDLEITEITDRASKNIDFPNKALLFNKVEGYSMPVLTNAFGSFDRMNLALGVNNIKEIASRIEELLKPEVPDSLMGKVSMLPKLFEVGTFLPQIVKDAPCQEVVITDMNQPILDKLPVLKCWPQDGGKFITLPLVVTKNPATGARNVGMYRLQKYDNTTTGMHWHKHHDGAKNFEEFKKLKLRTSSHCEGSSPPQCSTPAPQFDVAVAIGGDPAITYAATAPLPPGIDEMIFAGFLRKKPVKLVKCKTVDLEVPADAEIILEGYIDQEELRTEGPFGDHTGYYSLSDEYPVFHITAMTHRKNPVYPATIVGKPPQEDCYMGKATEQIFLPVLKQIIPEIVDMNLPMEGVFHNCAIISINKRYPGHANKTISAVWGLGQLMFTKFVIITDSDVDVHNISEVSWKIFNNVDPARDCTITKGPLDMLDHASQLPGYGGKMGIDATKKWKEEGFVRDWPEEITMSEEIKKRVNEKFYEFTGRKFGI
ncbi:MAG: menaquinone biosynthesis decarboxylase [Candidatus Gastranaerophilales bacterium]|nr:menaquinone biosynthesis decarboxylase [Candidatus Gastranaerophilales bacterium]